MSALDLDTVCGHVESDRADTVLRKSDGKLRIVGMTGQFPGPYLRKRDALPPRVAMAGMGRCETRGKAFPSVVHPIGEE